MCMSAFSLLSVRYRDNDQTARGREATDHACAGIGVADRPTALLPYRRISSSIADSGSVSAGVRVVAHGKRTRMKTSMRLVPYTRQYQPRYVGYCTVGAN